jgi:hypothetical protein
MKFLDDNELCPICFIRYGYQEDGRFISRDGKVNSDYAVKGGCAHYICVPCCMSMKNLCNIKRRLCPLCREDWSNWLQDYNETDEDETDSEDESDNEES